MSHITGWDAWTLDEDLVYGEFAPFHVTSAAWPIQQMNFVSAARKLKCRPFTQKVLEHKVYLEWKREQAEKEKRRGFMDWKKEQSEREEKKLKEKDFLEWKKDQAEKEKMKEEERKRGKSQKTEDKILRDGEVSEANRTKMDEEKRREAEKSRDEEKSKAKEKRRVEEERNREQEEALKEAVKRQDSPTINHVRGSPNSHTDHPSPVSAIQEVPNPGTANAHFAGFTLWEWAVFNEFANVHRAGGTWPIEQMDGVVQQRQLACRPFTQRALDLEFRRHPNYREQLHAREAAAATVVGGRGAAWPPRRTVITLGDALKERALREAREVDADDSGGDGDGRSSASGGDNHEGDSDAGLGSGGSERSWRSGDRALARERAMSF